MLFPLANIAKNKTCPAHAKAPSSCHAGHDDPHSLAVHVLAHSHTHVVVDAAPHDGFPGRWCAALLPRSEPLPGAPLELQQDQEARKLGGGVVGQRAQQQVIDIVHMNPANGKGGSSSRQTHISCMRTHMDVDGAARRGTSQA